MNASEQELSPDQIELLQLAWNGAVLAVAHLSEYDLNLSFRFAELSDLPEGVTMFWPQHFDFDKPHLSARVIASAIRNGYLAMPEQDHLPFCVGATTVAELAVTEKTEQLLKEVWPVFTDQAAFGDDGWTGNDTVRVRRAWLVPGNIVHSSHGVRCQISGLQRQGLVTQIWSGHTDHTERYDSDSLIKVETSSLWPGQRYLKL